MKNFFIGVGVFLGVIVLFYLLWIAFIPIIVGQKIVERKVLENSPQYVITQRSAINELYPQYLQAKDNGVEIALKNQLCGIAINIPKDEWPTEILNVCN